MNRGEQLVVQGRGTRVSPPLQLFLPPPPSLPAAFKAPEVTPPVTSLCFNQFKLRKAKAAQGRVDWWSAVLHAAQEEEEEEGLGGNFVACLEDPPLQSPLTIICLL